MAYLDMAASSPIFRLTGGKRKHHRATEMVSAIARKSRSPAFPFISLRKAMDRAREFYVPQRHHPAPMAAAVKLWGYKPKSSGGLQTVAALKQFGLMEDEGSGADRRVKLTDLALRIIRDQRDPSPERDAAMREAALKPRIHDYLREKWGSTLPARSSVVYDLVHNRGFTESAADDLIREYEDTIRFAKLDDSDKAELRDSGAGHEYASQIEVGDLVQWASDDGVLRLEQPKRVRAIQEHEGRAWVFVEGSETGIPLDQVVVEQKMPGIGSSPPVLPEAPPTPGTRREVFTLDEGDVVLTFPESLSAESFGDLEGFLELFLRKARRRAGLSAKG